MYLRRQARNGNWTYYSMLSNS